MGFLSPDRDCGTCVGKVRAGCCPLTSPLVTHGLVRSSAVRSCHRSTACTALKQSTSQSGGTWCPVRYTVREWQKLQGQIDVYRIGSSFHFLKHQENGLIHGIIYVRIFIYTYIYTYIHACICIHADIEMAGTAFFQAPRPPEAAGRAAGPRTPRGDR